MENEFKVETHTHIITWLEGYLIIEEKDSDKEPIIKEIEELKTIHQATINSIYPIIEWVVKEMSTKKKRKYTKRKKDEKQSPNRWPREVPIKVC